MTFSAHSPCRPSPIRRAGRLATSPILKMPVKAEAALKDELQKLLAGNALTDEEFNAQRQSLLDQRMVRRSQDATLAAQLVTLADADRSFTFVADLEGRIAKPDTGGFRCHAAYLRMSELSSFVAGDFSKVK